MSLCKRLLMLAATLLALPALACAEDAPVFQDAYVHDPSVILAEDGYFYIYGSHMAAARTKDWLQWEMLSTDAQKGCTLVKDVQTQMQDALTWAKTNTFWAPDVCRLADGRYYLYYCCCEGSSPLSALGVAVSDSPAGPFEDLGVFLRSGTADAAGDGVVYDATVHPNVIDPNVFHDKDGQLWMVYGSYSGGIYILRLDEGTGFPLPGQGYGKKLLGKNHSRIEAPYILYAPDTDYYYLFLSFGGLTAADGYNIRVCRSKNPDGPYLDALGQDMIDCGGAAGTFFDDLAIAPYGVKLMGGFRFMPLEGETALPECAYKSPGHNSAYYDPQTGRYYMVLHTRFSALGEEHRVRVHEFWLNDAGWPVVAPLRYAGTTQSRITPNPIGQYRVVRHLRDMSKFQHRSVLVTFGEDGSISGEAAGSWHQDGESFSVTLDGVAYTGRLAVGYDAQQNGWTTVCTLLSADGAAVWGLRTIAQ